MRGCGRFGGPPRGVGGGQEVREEAERGPPGATLASPLPPPPRPAPGTFPESTHEPVPGRLPPRGGVASESSPSHGEWALWGVGGSRPRVLGCSSNGGWRKKSLRSLRAAETGMLGARPEGLCPAGPGRPASSEWPLRRSRCPCLPGSQWPLKLGRTGRAACVNANAPSVALLGSVGALAACDVHALR